MRKRRGSSSLLLVIVSVAIVPVFATSVSLGIVAKSVVRAVRSIPVDGR